MAPLPLLRYLRVLLVDDDARTTERLARMLREDGYEVDMAIDGARALERLEKSQVHVLVTELRTPPGGVSLVRLARAANPALSIIALTSHPHLGAALERELDPPALVLTKPLVYDELQAHLALMASSRLGRTSEARRP